MWRAVGMNTWRRSDVAAFASRVDWKVVNLLPAPDRASDRVSEVIMAAAKGFRRDRALEVLKGWRQFTFAVDVENEDSGRGPGCDPDVVIFPVGPPPANLVFICGGVLETV